MCAHFPTYSQCQILYCYTCGLLYAGATQGELPERQEKVPCIAQGKTCGFRVLQFNAVVKSNTGALALYKKLGFTQLGVIPGGFLNKDGEYEDIIPHYHVL